MHLRERTAFQQMRWEKYPTKLTHKMKAVPFDEILNIRTWSPRFLSLPIATCASHLLRLRKSRCAASPPAKIYTKGAQQPVTMIAGLSSFASLNAPLAARVLASLRRV